MKQKLRIDKNFIPCPVADGDELFPNGIFVFNITKMIEYIERNPNAIIPEEVSVKDFSKGFSPLDETYIDSLEISRPVILAEISPEQFNLIDGHHRMEKARRIGLKSIQAYRLTAKQHMQFLINREAYISYIKYWNDKLCAYEGSTRKDCKAKISSFCTSKDASIDIF
ncbi:MAG: ParB N-terminal domain-containing protein [Desulfobacterales bacterium]|nr:ParB N-terminal domain-containing protein [Desulfobacterales bacterium]